MQEKEAVDDEPGDEHCADCEGRSAHHAEEPQRLVRKTYEETDRKDDQHTARVFADRINFAAAVLLRLTNVHFHDLEALPVRQHGQEPMLISVQHDLLEYAAFHGAGAATQIVVMLARHLPDEPMKGIPA